MPRVVTGATKSLVLYRPQAQANQLKQAKVGDVGSVPYPIWLKYRLQLIEI